MRLGFHLSIAGSLRRAVAQAQALGCHALQIHGPADLSAEAQQAVGTAPAEVDALHAVEATVVSTTPNPSNPMGFAVVAGCFVAVAAVALMLLKSGYKLRY